MNVNLLTDKSKILAILVNCQCEKNIIFCGIAIFRGGLSGNIEVSDGNHTFNVRVPDEVADCATYKIFASKSDNVEIEICAQ